MYPNKAQIQSRDDLPPEGSSTVTETAFYLGCVPATVRRQIAANIIKAFRLGRHLRVPNTEIRRIKYGE